ncbi:MAG TPA: ATP-binding protein [Clostridia bacterium]|jgi:ATP-dependent DNA helicase RecG|nr:HTH domain-containing protein [Clostridiaceae bacterium]HQG00478.1 ATP-binding protein [Clostridia bacterium]HQJ92581.1 ATP-binding protein [Clostridia bacterium]
MADRVIDLIYLKYLKAAISYYKDTRVETYPFAREAVREAVFNAIIHCNWAENVPVQIKIEDDVMYVGNCSMLPFGWTAENLLGSHVSKPYNPDIARVFYRAGYIENRGRGIQKIREACVAHGAEDPEYIVHGGDIMVKFKALQSAIVTDTKVPDATTVLKNLNDVGHNVGHDVGHKLEPNERRRKIVDLLFENPNTTAPELSKVFSLNVRTIERDLAKLTEEGFIEYIGSSMEGAWKVKKR